MKVVMFLSNAFTHDPRVYNEALSLVKAGYKVTVIAWDVEKQNPPEQNWDGIDVIRPRTRYLPIRRYLPLSWTLNRILWQRHAYRQALILNEERRLDIIHCHDLDTLGIGIKLKAKFKIPLIYDAHEIYGYMKTRTLPQRIAAIFLWLEERWVRRVDRIINVGEAQKAYFESITDKPISVIMNCKPLQSIEYVPPSSEGDFTVLYIGGLHEPRGILMLVHAVKELAGVSCLIGGIGGPKYIETLKQECSRTSNVTFLGRVPLQEVIPMTQKADVVFCMFDPRDPNSLIGTPNKLFEAMVCGRPIICTKGTYSGEITEQEEVGLAVDYSEHALKDAIIKLRDNPGLREKLGRNALELAITKYNWEKQEEKLLQLYISLKV
jgi:glycosyltransferase involved in cell wall biosynthesis